MDAELEETTQTLQDACKGQIDLLEVGLTEKDFEVEPMEAALGVTFGLDQVEARLESATLTEDDSYGTPRSSTQMGSWSSSTPQGGRKVVVSRTSGST